MPDVQVFYDPACWGNWFEVQRLDTGQYFGLKEDGRLVSVAGVHVYSPGRRGKRGVAMATQIAASLFVGAGA